MAQDPETLSRTGNIFTLSFLALTAGRWVDHDSSKVFSVWFGGVPGSKPIRHYIWAVMIFLSPAFGAGTKKGMLTFCGQFYRAIAALEAKFPFQPAVSLWHKLCKCIVSQLHSRSKLLTVLHSVSKCLTQSDTDLTFVDKKSKARSSFYYFCF